MASHPKRVELIEGPDAAQRFESTLRRIVSVPKDELSRREAAYQKSRQPKKRRPSSPNR
jgi:hypothetical protein